MSRRDPRRLAHDPDRRASTSRLSAHLRLSRPPRGTEPRLYLDPEPRQTGERGHPARRPGEMPSSRTPRMANPVSSPETRPTCLGAARRNSARHALAGRERKRANSSPNTRSRRETVIGSTSAVQGIGVYVAIVGTLRAVCPSADEPHTLVEIALARNPNRRYTTRPNFQEGMGGRRDFHDSVVVA